ncbi:MAG: histidine phosphatase family protein [Phycisphaerales bacterium]
MKTPLLSVLYVLGTLLVLTLGVGGCASDSTVILVRHAEKGPGADPNLTSDGQQRAQALRDAIDRSGVTAMFVTDTNRTQQTAAPTATALGITPVVVPLGNSAQAHAADVASRIRARAAGSRTLVVGHSNTVPLIIQELGISNPPAVAESEFDRLFVVMRRKNSSTRLIEVKYGN